MTAANADAAPNVRVHTLLVGINTYQDSTISTLSGCVNDVQEFKAFLDDRLAKKGSVTHNLLLDAQASKKAVVDGLQSLAANVNPDDIALFYYSGHGSKEIVPNELRFLELDGLNETLVCHDSRTPDVFDLADKELAYLLDHISAKCKHVLVILDSCHSGDGTRGLEDKARLAATSRMTRPLSSYVFAADPDWQTREVGGVGASGWQRGRHVLLAACRSNQLAKENTTTKRGRFSTALLETLNVLSLDISYADLMREVQAKLRVQGIDQNPQLETVAPNERFFGGAISPKPYFILNFTSAKGGTIDGGTLHGLVAPTNGQHTTLGVFENLPENEDPQLAEALGQVDLTSVALGEGAFQVRTWASADGPKLRQNYRAIVLGLPMAAVAVQVSGDAVGTDLLRKALVPNGTEPLRVQAVTNDDAPLWLEATGGEYWLAARDGRTVLVPAHDGTYDADRAARALDQIARWRQVRTLRNAQQHWLKPDSVRVQVEVLTGATADLQAKIPDLNKLKRTPLDHTQNIRLEYGLGDVPPCLLFTIENQSPRSLFFSLVDTTEQYELDPLPMLYDLKRQVVKLEPKLTEGSVCQTRVVFQIPDQDDAAIAQGTDLRSLGISEAVDLLKLVISTEEFTPLFQSALNVVSDQRSVPPNQDQARSIPVLSPLQRAFEQIGTRKAVVVGANPNSNLADWMTLDFSITTTRPFEKEQVRQDGTPVRLSGVSIGSHPSLMAVAKLVTLPTATRGIGGPSLPPMLQFQAEHQPGTAKVEPIQFATSTRSVPRPGFQAQGAELTKNAIELTAPDGMTLNPRVVTPQQPLTLHLDATLNETETLLASAFDPATGLWLPLGIATQADAKQDGLEIKLERLPEATGGEDRSIGTAIRILFHKFVADVTGSINQYPVLRVVDHATLLASGEVKYSEIGDQAPIIKAVQAARTILILVHGIIGDTLGMAQGLVPKHLGPNLADLPAVAERYDAILTFDYESVNSGIDGNAQGLQVRLGEAGLGQDDGKTVHIVAHSMGGLISRQYIEFHGGAKVIDKLVMLGTPNAGSPWATAVPYAQGMITSLVAIGLNALGTTVWPVKLLGGAVAWLGRQKAKNLEEMKENSPVLVELAKAPDPQIPYVLICGDITTDAAKNAIFTKLRDRLVSTSLFLNKANDIATSVDGSHTIAKDRKPNPTLVTIPCDHLSYFNDREGLMALEQAVSILP
jgi:triacylglycerol esterase/lipase EstA (alpha/beta hydrolase family)